MRLAVYGSLREGMFNNSLLKVPNVKYLGEGYVNGFYLVDLGCYPGAMVSKPQDRIKVDIYDVDNERAQNYIDSMESGAGYVKRIVTAKLLNSSETIDCNMYAYNYGREKPRILEDWVEHYNNKFKVDL